MPAGRKPERPREPAALTVHVPVRVGRVGAEVAKGSRLEVIVKAVQVAEAAVEASGLGEVRGGGAAHVPAQGIRVRDSRHRRI